MSRFHNDRTVYNYIKHGFLLSHYRVTRIKISLSPFHYSPFLLFLEQFACQFRKKTALAFNKINMGKNILIFHLI